MSDQDPAGELTDEELAQLEVDAKEEFELGPWAQEVLRLISEVRMLRDHECPTLNDLMQCTCTHDDLCGNGGDHNSDCPQRMAGE